MLARSSSSTSKPDRLAQTNSTFYRSRLAMRAWSIDRVKVSVATPLVRSQGGQFVAHVKALPGNPYDGHTLATVIPDLERQIGVSLRRILADAGYRGHNAPPDYRFKVYTSGQKRRMTDQIKRIGRRKASEDGQPPLARPSELDPAVSGIRDRGGGPPTGRSQGPFQGRDAGGCAGGARLVDEGVRGRPEASQLAPIAASRQTGSRSLASCRLRCSRRSTASSQRHEMPCVAGDR